MKRLVAIALASALVLTALVSSLASANGPLNFKTDCKVNGGANWEVPDEGKVFIQVNARLDKDGEPTGKVHWRQDQIGDQAAQNTVADVIAIVTNKYHPRFVSTVRLIAMTKGGAYFNAQLEDFGEPGGEADVAWVAPGGPGLVGAPAYSPPKDPNTIDNGNLQVECVPPEPPV